MEPTIKSPSPSLIDNYMNQDIGIEAIELLFDVYKQMNSNFANNGKFIIT
jgi:hypothetical protein